MLNLTAPAINQLQGEDAENLVAFYMNTPGLTKAHEWSLDASAEIDVAPPQPNMLRSSSPGAPGAGAAPRRAPQPTAEAAPIAEPEITEVQLAQTEEITHEQ